MATITDEFQRAQDARRDITDAATDRDAILHAFDGLGTILLTLLQEVRELRERSDA